MTNKTGILSGSNFHDPMKVLPVKDRQSPVPTIAKVEKRDGLTLYWLHRGFAIAFEGEIDNITRQGVVEDVSLGLGMLADSIRGLKKQEKP
jgi:hypothetical protein